MLKAFPEIDLIWLLSGVGEFLSTTTTPPQIEVPKTTPLNPISASPKETALIERIVIFYKNGSCKNYEMNTSK